jgi:hypothetical protein
MVLAVSTTLTIRNLAAAVKQQLRVQAAMHGRSMEAEAREILAQAVGQAPPGSTARTPSRGGSARTSVCQAVRGRWQGRGTTDEIMKLTRGD